MSSSICLISPALYTYSSFAVQSVTCQLFTGASVLIGLFGPDGSFVQSRTLTMDTTDYNSWLQDDSYIISWVCSKMGFTPLA